MLIDWLLVGGPGNGEVLRICDRHSAVYRTEVGDYEYQAKTYLFRGDRYRLGYFDDGVHQDVDRMILDAGISPLPPNGEGNRQAAPEANKGEDHGNT